MNTRFVLIDNTLLAHVSPLVDALRNAINTGDLDGADNATGLLLTMTENAPACELPEKVWHRFLTAVRDRIPSFRSDYLLSDMVCMEILNSAPPIEFASVADILQSAVSTNAHVLQLPCGAEDSHV